jgi:D-cysteine desulfhydrase
MPDDHRVAIRWNQEAKLTQPQLVDLLHTFGDLLPAPLSGRMDLEAYASKLKARGDIGVALINEEIVGLQALYANDKQTLTAHLPFIAVLPACRSRGLGRTMLSRALALARQRGMQRLQLEVARENLRAQRLYQSLGFRFVPGDGPSLLMEIDLLGLATVGPSAPTPLQRAPRLAAMLGMEIDLWLKRDDLYPMPGGGIKARKIEYILRRAISDGHDVLVTNGGPQSNHARAAATVAAALGMKCHLVIVLQPGRQYPNTGNVLLMKQSGASIEYCNKEALAERMDRAMDFFADRGHKPIYIWGGGHCVEGTIAFVDAAHEAMRQCGDWRPDFVVAASATGSTQAGFAIGYAGTSTHVIGISAARPKERGGAVVRGCVDECIRKLPTASSSIEIDFRDDWTDGGYEEYSEELFAVIERAARAGVFVCPTYSGKALRGLVELVQRGEIRKDSKVLFWHTGGLMNLQAVKRYADGVVSL